VEIRILDLAEWDLESGFSFYEKQQPGLGDYFLDSVYADIDSLILFGGVHRRIAGFHRLLAAKFPFAIYYRHANDVIEVHAILDCRRDPLWIKRRLTKRRRST
jgi:hypothetical protein